MFAYINFVRNARKKQLKGYLGLILVYKCNEEYSILLGTKWKDLNNIYLCLILSCQVFRGKGHPGGGINLKGGERKPKAGVYFYCFLAVVAM